MGPASKWPRKIRKMFWTRGLKHKDRPIIIAFCYVNALNPVVNTYIEYYLFSFFSKC